MPRLQGWLSHHWCAVYSEHCRPPKRLRFILSWVSYMLNVQRRPQHRVLPRIALPLDGSNYGQSAVPTAERLTLIVQCSRQRSSVILRCLLRLRSWLFLDIPGSARIKVPGTSGGNPSAKTRIYLESVASSAMVRWPVGCRHLSHADYLFRQGYRVPVNQSQRLGNMGALLVAYNA